MKAATLQTLFDFPGSKTFWIDFIFALSSWRQSKESENGEDSVARSGGTIPSRTVKEVYAHFFTAASSIIYSNKVVATDVLEVNDQYVFDLPDGLMSAGTPITPDGAPPTISVEAIYTVLLKYTTGEYTQRGVFNSFNEYDRDLTPNGATTESTRIRLYSALPYILKNVKTPDSFYEIYRALMEWFHVETYGSNIRRFYQFSCNGYMHSRQLTEYQLLKLTYSNDLDCPLSKESLSIPPAYILNPVPKS